jgi:hypothetical protein
VVSLPAERPKYPVAQGLYVKSHDQRAHESHMTHVTHMMYRIRDYTRSEA